MACSAPRVDMLPLLDLSWLGISGEAEGDSIGEDVEFPESLVDGWDVAFRTHGFAYVRVPPSLAALYRRLAHAGVLDGFFVGQTAEEKMRYCLGEGYGRGGYVPRGVETVAKSGGTGAGVENEGKKASLPDPVETLCVNGWREVLVEEADDLPEKTRKMSRSRPTSPFPSAETEYPCGDELLTCTMQLWQQLDRLLQRVMELSAAALRLEGAERAAFLKGFRGSLLEGKGVEAEGTGHLGASARRDGRSLGSRASNVLRYARYCLDEDEDHAMADDEQERRENEGSGAEKSLVGQSSRLLYGAHTDYTGFTFLWRSGENGLQCLRNNRAGGDTDEKMGMGNWIDVSNTHGDDVIVVNAGDLLQRWTNDHWLSNVHRVVWRGNKSMHVTQRSGGQNFSASLYSIVFFTGPHDDTIIKRLKSEKLAALDDGPDKYPVTTSGAHLWEKISKSNT